MDTEIGCFMKPEVGQVMASIVWSVTAFIVGFATAYLDLSVSNLGAFSVKDTAGNQIALDEISALYFS